MAMQVSDNLFKHPNGSWAKKIKGKCYYFGTDEQQARKQWLRDKPYLLAGETPPRQVENNASPTVVELGNVYADHQAKQLAAGEIGSRHVRLCKSTIQRFIGIVGKDRRLETLTPVPFNPDSCGTDLLADAVLGPLHTEDAELDLTVYFGRRPSSAAADRSASFLPD
jgi:hypothetical protein